MSLDVEPSVRTTEAGAETEADHRPSAFSARRRAVSFTLVTIGVFLFYVVVQRAQPGAYDGKMMWSVARNIIEHHSLRTSGDFLGYNTPYSTYGIGFSLILLPFEALQRALDPDGAQWVTLANPLLLALTAGVVCLIGAELQWRTWVSAVTGIAFGLLTMALWQSTEILSEPGVTLAMALTLLGCLKWQRGRAAGSWLVGSGVAMAILFRVDSFLLFGLVLACLPLFVPWRSLLERRSLVALAVPIGAVVMWQLFYNWLRYGNPANMGYQGYGFTTPLRQGLEMLLLQPGKGFFHYDPLLLAAIPGVVLLWRRNRALAATITILAMVRVLFYARWMAPDGGAAWGPRLLVPMCALLVIPAGEVLSRVAGMRGLGRVVASVALGVLAAAAAVVNVASVWVAYENQYIIVSRPAPGADPTEPVRWEHTFYETWEDSHIIANLGMLSDGAAFPLKHWHGGLTTGGLLALGGSLSTLTLGVAVAISDDRRRRPASSTSSAVRPPASGFAPEVSESPGAGHRRTATPSNGRAGDDRIVLRPEQDVVQAPQ